MNGMMIAKESIAGITIIISWLILVALSAHYRSICIKSACIKLLCFLVPLLFLGLFFLSSHDYSLHALLLSNMNCERVPRVFVTASCYMFLVWRQKPLQSIKNGSIFTLFSFVTFPFFGFLFDFLGL